MNETALVGWNRQGSLPAGTRAVVFGGGSGLGAATAALLAAEGARVKVADANPETALAVADGFGGTAVGCDVTDGSGLRSLDLFGAGTRLVVNCAGIAPARRIVGRDGPLSLEAFRRVIDVNLVGSFNVLRLAAEAMAKNEPDAEGCRGTIILTASIAAWEGQIGQAAYAASKAGVVGLVLPAARELAAQGIRVMGIAPGIFETPMVAGMPEEVQKGLYATVPFPHRFGRPDEFARLVLAIYGNTMLNGTVIRLDGANRMAAR
jgi:NAD(P)-dependent dehydrogenase (short-subunit alcohol dehydrogenase family)